MAYFFSKTTSDKIRSTKILKYLTTTKNSSKNLKLTLQILHEIKKIHSTFQY